MNTLNRLETVAGDYGLYIKIKYTDEIDTTALQEKTFNFSQNDMYGDVYNFTNYFSQEAVFDISGLGNITNIDAFLYQNSNFKKIKSTADGNDDYELIPSKIIEKNQNGEIVYIEEMEPNIFVDNIKISLGYDLNNFDNDTVIVYTLDSAQYSSSDSAKAREREIQARWVHKTDDGFISVLEQDLANYNAQIHWYHYQLDEKVKQDEFGGKYWVPIKDYSGKQYLDKNDDYKCYIECDPAVQDENVKAVISLPSSERNEYLQEVSETLNKGDLISVDQIEILLKELNEAPNRLTNDDILEALNDLITKYTELESPTENEQKCLEYLNKINEEISGLPCIDLYSDIVQIHNTTQVQARLAVDLVQAVSISVGDEKDSYKGVYMIYGENGEIMNSSISAQRQKLILSYGSLLTGLKEFDGNGSELVSWRFPLTNTMIRMPVEGIEYINENIEYNGESIPSIQYRNDAGEITEAENATWAIINRVIEKTDGEDKIIKIGDFDLKTTEQIFRIKDYYTSVGRNTIYCEIQKGGYVYVAEITLIFGVAGTSGTDYTLRIIPSKTAISYDETTKTSQITLTAHVYDYNNQEVEIKNIDYSFVSPNSLDTALTEIPDGFPAQFEKITGSTTDTVVKVNFKPAEVNNSKYYVIVKASAQIDTLDTYLTTFFPLSWSSNLSDYNHFEGPDKIIYSAQGANPFYYKNNFALYSKLDKEVSGITWSLEAYDTDLSYDEETKQYKPAKKFYPSLLANNGLYSLKVPSMYIKENHLCRLVGKIKNDIVWIQPLYIAQNAYNSPLLNAWDENVSIDEEGGTIMAPMIGAGKKNNNNQFSGVLMGDVKAKVDNSVALTGLYGYQNGIQTFSLTEDGKAKFGASGGGQIQIDGETGFIQSGNYAVNDETGMKIDLEKGHIDAYNFKLTSRKITIDSSNNQKDKFDYFTIKGDGEIEEVSYTVDNEIIKDYTTTTTTVNNQVLINIGNKNYYLQTLNFNKETNHEAGLRLDLQKGTLTAYSGFNLTAVSPQVKVNTGDEDVYQRGVLSLNATAAEFPLQLKLGKDTPFKLSWIGYLYTTKLQAIGGTVGGWEINSKGLMSSNKKIELNNDSSNTITINTPTTTITYTGSYISIGNKERISTVVSYSSYPADPGLTGHAEGSFTSDDIGKYYKKGEGNFYKIVSTDPPYYLTKIDASADSGVHLLGDGRLIAKNLYIEGGEGRWNGSVRWADYTDGNTHSHPLSGQKTVITTTGKDWMRKIDNKASDINKIIMYDIENYTITCNCSGDTNKGLTISATVSPNIGSKYTYYTPNAYNHATATYNSSAVTYYTQTFGFLGIPIYSKVNLKAQRTGESEIKIIEV